MGVAAAGRCATLSGRGPRVYTAHKGWLGVVTGISAASTGGVLVHVNGPFVYEGLITRVWNFFDIFFQILFVEL